MKRLWRWVSSFWRKEETKKLLLTDEILSQEVGKAVQTVLFYQNGEIPIGKYDVLDKENQAMSIFVGSIQSRYFYHKKHLVKARKLIKQYRYLFETGRFI